MDDFAETRLQEAEIKLAFLEKELADSRDAVDALYEELSRLARRVKALESGEAGQAGGVAEGADGSGFEPETSAESPAS